MCVALQSLDLALGTVYYGSTALCLFGVSFVRPLSPFLGSGSRSKEAQRGSRTKDLAGLFIVSFGVGRIWVIIGIRGIHVEAGF